MTNFGCVSDLKFGAFRTYIQSVSWKLNNERIYEEIFSLLYTHFFREHPGGLSKDEGFDRGWSEQSHCLAEIDGDDEAISRADRAI